VGALAALIAVVSLAPRPAAGQTPTTNWVSLRTPWGDPDLQGVWNNAATASSKVITPLERPGERELERQATREAAPPSFSYFFEGGKALQRKWLIVDPADGILPYTPEGRKQADAFAAQTYGNGGTARCPPGTACTDSYEDRNVYDRCITRGLPGSMMPGFYNHNYHILQTPGYVAVVVEMIHDVRIIPVDGRPHLNQRIRQWLGNSRGHWEGNTLVVETTNFTDKVTDRGLTLFGTGKDARLVERFTRLDADTIDYQFTVDDTSVFTGPWTAAIPMTRVDGPLFEYACHEGNYGLLNILSSARNQEKAAQEAK
jgi:hypothetical protein